MSHPPPMNPSSATNPPPNSTALPSSTAASEGMSVAQLPPEALDLATRLFESARNGETEIFEQVLARSERIRDLSNEKGDSLIMLASYHGHLPLTKLLLWHGANPNRLNERMQSPLAGAIFKGEDDIVHALLDGGADPRIGEPSALGAVEIFKQDGKWGEIMRAKAKEIEEKEGSLGNGHGPVDREEKEEIYEEAKVTGE